MTAKKPCWSWRYRIAISNRLGAEACSRLIKLCQDTFGCDSDRYDITYRLRRLNRYSWYPRYFYTSVKIHFKSQEDLVLFKLRANLDQFYE